MWAKISFRSYFTPPPTMLLPTAYFVKIFHSITLQIWTGRVQKVKIFLFLQNFDLVMTRWQAVQAKRGKKTTKSEVRKTIFDVKFPTSKVIFLTFEVVLHFFGQKIGETARPPLFVVQRYNRIEQNPNFVFRSYPQVRVVYPLFCNQSALECQVLH